MIMYVAGILGNPQEVHLSGKITSNGKWAVLNGVEGLEEVMHWVFQKASNARTKPVGLEVKNMAVSLFILQNKRK